MASINELPDIDLAMQQLEAAEAAESTVPQESQVQEAEPKEESIQPDSTEKDVQETDLSKDEGTSEPVDKPVNKEEEKKQEDGKQQTPFKKNAERLDKSWKSVNEQKAAIAKEREAIEAERKQIELQRKEVEAQRVKAERRYSPEQYDTAATQKLESSKQLELQADGLDRRADKADENGDYDAAEKLRAEAASLRESALTEKGMARQLATYAKQLRDNPEPSIEQVKQQKAAELKHYTIEAAKVFPDLAKDGSEFQKRTAEHLNAAATKYGMDANEYPALMYFAAQMTHLEQQASQVPSMAKELATLKTKIKEYEKLNAPGGGSESSSNIMVERPKTDEDEGNELRAAALEFRNLYNTLNFMGATINTGTPADYSNRVQKYFSRELLKALMFNLRLGSYGVAKELPANSAANTIRFFRPRRALKGKVSLLSGGTPASGATVSVYDNPVDGVTPSQQAGASIGYVDIMLQQRGALSSVSDILRAVDLFDTLKVNTTVMAADAALDFDFVCSHAICSQAGVADSDGSANPIPTGQKTMYGSNTSFERFAGVTNTLNSANDFATLAGLSNSNAKLTRAVHLGAVTRLRGVGGVPSVPMINGKYVALIAPEVMYDLRQDSTWLASAQFNNNKKAGELNSWVEFELDGCQFVENQSAFMETSGNYGKYSPDASGDLSNNVYSNIYLGAEAFGVPKLSGMRAGSDPKAPSLIVLDKADKADPLNQQTTFGWKAFYQAGLLWTNETYDLPHVVVLRSKTTMV